MHEIANWFDYLLGLAAEEREFGALQMAVRALVIYLSVILIVRLGKSRFLGKATVFDVLLGFILGSVAGRTVTGDAPFFPSLAAIATLVAMHWLFSRIAMGSHGFGNLIKGKSRLLIKDGKIDWTEMRKAHLSENDLWEGLRSKNVARLDEVAEARLERNGEISVIRSHR